MKGMKGGCMRRLTEEEWRTIMYILSFPSPLLPSSSSFQKLDGLNVYTGCCSLKIEYSNLPNLIITHNSDKAR